MTKLFQILGLLMAIMGVALTFGDDTTAMIQISGVLLFCFGILFIALGSMMNRQAKFGDALERLVEMQRTAPTTPSITPVSAPTNGQVLQTYLGHQIKKVPGGVAVKGQVFTNIGDAERFLDREA